MALIHVTYNNVDAYTGFGKFDLEILPPSVLKVIVKVHVELDQALTDKGFDKNGYLTTWRQKVNEVWANKIKIKVDEVGGEELTAQFVIQEVTTKPAAHFQLKLKPGYAQSSGVYPPKGTATDFHLELAENDNKPYYEANAANIRSGSLGPNPRTKLLFDMHSLIAQAIGGQASVDIRMKRLPNGWEVDVGSRGTLNALCTAITNTPDYIPQPPVKISASSGIRSKAQALADTVILYMRARGVNAPALVSDVLKTRRKFRWAWTPHKQYAQVNIEILSVNEMFKRVDRGQGMGDYVVSSHEFGHLLGLPDEYLDYSSLSNQTIIQSQPRWDNLCDLHTPPVPKRNWRAAFNNSIMSIGRLVFKAHAVTIWKALEDETGLDWVITSPP